MCVNYRLSGFVTYVWLKIENPSRMGEMGVFCGGRPQRIEMLCIDE